jgi:tetratricopeptide (TPR) repeat protein
MARAPIPRIFLPLLILSAAVWFTFAGTLKNQFVNWDDQNEICENPHFNPVTFDNLMWNWSHTQLSLYMPVTYMVWGGVAAVAHRDNARAFHELNLILHLACTLLVFALILQLWKRAWPAAIGALVFAVHPLQVEAVAWASGMYTLLSTAFSLAAMIAYIAYATKPRAHRMPVAGGTQIFRPQKSGMPVYALATLFYILALLTKAASVSVPLAAMVIDVLILRRPFRKSIRSLSLWIILAIPIVLIAKSFQDVSSLKIPPLWTRPVVALDATGFYLRKIILPIHLIPDYGRNPTWVMLRHNRLPVAVSVAIAVFAILFAYVARRNAAWITAGLGLLLAGIAPYLGLTTFDFQYVSTVADRYAYFGMLGVALLAAGLAIRSRRAIVGVLFAICVCIPISRKQVDRWNNTNSLFNYTLTINSNSLVSHNVFGYLAAKEGHFAEAEADYQAGLQIWPEDATIQFNLGNLYLNQASKEKSRGQQLLNLAIDHYSLAVQFQPRFVLYRNSFAAALARASRLAEAYDQWKTTLAMDTAYIDARNNLADILAANGKRDEARSEYHAVLRIDPNNRHALDGLMKLANDKIAPIQK